MVHRDCLSTQHFSVFLIFVCNFALAASTLNTTQSMLFESVACILTDVRYH